MKLSKKMCTLLILGCLTATTACSLDKLEDINNSHENPGITATVNRKDSNGTEDPAADINASENNSEKSAESLNSTDNSDNTDSLNNTDNITAAAADDLQTGNSSSDDKASEITPTQQPAADDLRNDDSSSDISGKAEETVLPTAPPADVPQTDSSLPTATPQPTEAVSATKAPTPTPATEIITTAPEAPTPSADDGRDDYWDSTFLIWVPAFRGGSFKTQDARGTYDYAIFSDATLSQAEDYVKSCKTAGFTRIITDSSAGSTLSFKAANDSDWCVSVEYDGRLLTIGSGFEDSSTDTEDIINGLYSDTMLRYIPRFMQGTYESSESTDDDEQFTYIYYSDVKEADVRDFISSLKDAGYIYAPEEGDRDGIIWYIALNEDVFSCYVAYDNGILKIGCGNGD